MIRRALAIAGLLLAMGAGASDVAWAQQRPSDARPDADFAHAAHLATGSRGTSDPIDGDSSGSRANDFVPVSGQPKIFHDPIYPPLATHQPTASSVDAGRSTLPEVLPRVLSSVAPVYPIELRRAGIEGQVIVKALVGHTGIVESVVVVRSEPKGLFDSAAVQAARQTRYSQSLSGDSSASVWIMTPYNFRLHVRPEPR